MKELTPFEIIQASIYTEKADRLRESHNCFTFRVHPLANKLQIRRAVETLFQVKVKKVRIVHMKAKPRGRMWRRGRSGTKAAWKKAYVQLPPGHTIEIYRF